jgi:hypothetical protein
LIEQPMRVDREAEQDVLEIEERRHIDQFAALHERVEERRSAGALEAAGKQPVFPSDRNEAQLILGTRMPPAGLCRVSRAGDRIKRTSWRSIVADAA